MRIASPSIRSGSKAWIERRCKRRRAVQQHRMALGHFLENVPDFRRLALDHLLGAAHGVDVAELLQATDDERLEQDERHLLRQPALVEFQFRTDDDDRTAGIIDAFAEQVLAETAALALEHVAERLERTIARAGDGTAVAAVVEERIDRFLQHALFVADDDVRRLELQEVLEPVVAVDDAAIEIVQIGGREPAAFERNERTQIRRDDRAALRGPSIRDAICAEAKPCTSFRRLASFLRICLLLRVAHRFLELLVQLARVRFRSAAP